MSPTSPRPTSVHRSSSSTVASTPSLGRSSTDGSTHSGSTPSFFSRIKTSRCRSNSPANRSNTSPLPLPIEDARRPHRLHLRSDSAMSTGTMPTPSPRGRSRSAKRSSGRHGNDWLFGGFSFTEAVKGLISPSHDGHHHLRNRE
ncbi:MAG: hypothetical protein LQ340_002674 [Diploschistes diacapsis]|nr:MAG: hypothetical protein LQ340_002674 [Diploschistes diacapsis]